MAESNGRQVEIHLYGRLRWALDNLIRAGERGCTPIDHPGPRWSAYVHKLKEHGRRIETAHERHEGASPGTHARYVLRSTVARPRQSGAR
ncbi:hypothetical protein DEM26_16605 [Thioclava sp. NG1]|nr:hypothetical protein DEM26_16605 [Thioclava sp. NG1]